MECILNSTMECSKAGRMSADQGRTSSLAPSFSILEPTPIDPTRIVTVQKVPFDSSPLGNIAEDEIVLSALCEVLRSSNSSTPIIGLSPKMTSLLLEVESICSNTEVDDAVYEKTHQGIATWSKAGLHRLRNTALDLENEDGDNHASARSIPTMGVLKVKPTTTSCMRHLSPCCSPEPSPCNTTTVAAQKKSSKNSITSCEEFPTMGDSSGATTIFRINQTEQWYQRYLDLIKFRETYGHCLVPLNWPSNPSLAHWVKRQRHQYRAKREHKHSTLTEERQTLLERLGFVWDSHASGWEERLKELQDFKEKHGHCRVPKTYAVNPHLAIWVKCQRRQFKLYSEGKDSNMTNERIHKLRKLGFVFTPRKQRGSLLTNFGDVSC